MEAATRCRFVWATIVRAMVARVLNTRVVMEQAMTARYETARFARPHSRIKHAFAHQARIRASTNGEFVQLMDVKFLLA